MTQIIERPAGYGDDAHEPPLFTPVPTTTTLTMVQAINRALHDAMAHDDRVLVFGEDVARSAASSGSPRGSPKPSATERCFDTPLAESAIVGISVGFAIRGFVPVPGDPVRRVRLPGVRPDRQPPGQVPRPGPTATSHACHLRGSRRSAESVRPNTIRTPPRRYWVHTAGLKVVVPSTPTDAYWLLRHSIASRDPVVFLEPKRRYWTREVVDTSARRGRPSAGPRSAASATTSPCSPTAAWSASRWRPRIWPPTTTARTWRSSTCDRSTRSTSTRSRRRCAGPAVPSSCTRAPARSGSAPRSPARVQEELFYDLEAPVLRVTGFDTPYPPARLESCGCPASIDCSTASSRR